MVMLTPKKGAGRAEEGLGLGLPYPASMQGETAMVLSRFRTFLLVLFVFCL